MLLELLSLGLSATRVPFGRVCKAYPIHVVGTSTRVRT